MIFKVLGILKGLFQKSLKRVQGRALALPHKPQFLLLKIFPSSRLVATENPWGFEYNKGKGHVKTRVYA